MAGCVQGSRAQEPWWWSITYTPERLAGPLRWCWSNIRTAGWLAPTFQAFIIEMLHIERMQWGPGTYLFMLQQLKDIVSTPPGWLLGSRPDPQLEETFRQGMVDMGIQPWMPNYRKSSMLWKAKAFGNICRLST